jgi:hypothetical protein
MANDLDEKLENILGLIKENKGYEEEIKDLNEFIKTNNTNAKNLINKIKNKREQKEIPSNQILDYCIYHFGLSANNYIKKTEEFLSVLNKLPNEKILIINFGGTAPTSEIDNTKYRIPETYLLGRLENPTYDIELPRRRLTAKVKNNQKFIEGIGWERNTKKENLYLDKFLNQTFLWFENILDKKITNPTDLPFGTCITYDNEIISTLIIGTERVNKYLENKEFQITKTISAGKVPEV